MEAIENVSQQQLIQAIEKLPTPELNSLVTSILKLQASRRAPQLRTDEARLLKEASRRFSEEKTIRLHGLQEKRERGDLSPEEYQELATLTDALEEFHAKRITAAVKIAQIRGTSLPETLKQIGLNLPDYDRA